jgi:hypothetical protein
MSDFKLSKKTIDMLDAVFLRKEFRERVLDINPSLTEREIQELIEQAEKDPET